MPKLLVIAAVFIALLPLEAKAAKAKAKKQEITFEAADKVTVTADLYLVPSKRKRQSSPIIVLLHMANSSRGEYKLIAPALVKSGYNCLAVDLRAGSGKNDAAKGVKNKTAESAIKLSKARGFGDCMPDIEAAFAWIDKNKFKGPRILVGSSFSSALSLIYAGRNDGKLKAVLALSPAEYIQSSSVAAEAAKIKSAAAYLLAGNAEEKARAQKIFDGIASKQKQLFAPKKGGHGTRAFGNGMPKGNFASFKKFIADALKKPVKKSKQE